ncbi:MAG: dihydropteroate synthase [Anaerolineales bacterium]
MLHSAQMTIGGREFVWGQRTYLMAILNLTPDSFSGDGLITAKNPVEAAVAQARAFVAAGADILDVGGESTRPGAQPVSVDEEMARVLPVIQALRDAVDVPVSIDTWKSQVAEAALRAGAALLNDVWGFKADPQMAQVAARYGVPVVLMHNRSSWAQAEVRERLGGRYVGVPYQNLLAEVQQELRESVDIAIAAGVRPENILLDPGIGFGKTVEQNLELLNRLEEVRTLGYPLLLGASRKSFIGYTLNLPPEDRTAGTAAAVAVAIVRRADVVRVHDVSFMAQVCRMTDAIVRR